jgi:hypothetical protein
VVEINVLLSTCAYFRLCQSTSVSKLQGSNSFVSKDDPVNWVWNV